MKKLKHWFECRFKSKHRYDFFTNQFIICKKRDKKITHVCKREFLNNFDELI